ncbi:uncharacterized protein [Narcine bancroftii]|uniref:uncharacterized protein isoform X6 n=1 Tax=Narcine bancroftii TaxID=1343680 RepID=UPI0038318318
MDKALVDEVPTYNHWTSRNYVIHKRWSLNDTKTSSVQQDLSNSVYRLHSEEIKSVGSQAVKRISHLGSIVSKRRAFFESAMKLPVPFTQEQVKCSRDPSTLKACNPNTAGTCHLLKDGGNEEIMTNKSEESNRLGPIQKHPAAEKRGQLIGLYQAICEKVRQSSYDSRQNISEEVDKEKVSPTLQDRLRCLLIEESSNQEEHEVRSKHQNPQQNDCSYDSVTESSISRHPSLKPLNKYQKTQFLESKSAFNHKKKDPIARVSAAANSWQRRSPLAKVPGRPPLNITANNGEQEFDSPGWSSSFQTPSGDIKPSESLTMSQMEDIRQHLQSLEANFQELVALLSRDRGTVAARRKLKQKGQSTVKNGKPWAQLKLQRQKDICIVQRRFAHLEAHILLLVRNIAHLTEEVGSQNFLLQKIHSFQLKIKKTEKAFNEEVWNPKRLSMKQDSSSTLECSQYGGESPSMLTIFLKKLGCEEKGRKGSGRSTDRKSANLWHMTMHRTDVAEGSKSNLSRFVADHSTQALRSTFQERWHKLHRSSFL